jgi:predicted SprT family Zn-dependent metalloprotease
LQTRRISALDQATETVRDESTRAMLHDYLQRFSLMEFPLKATDDRALFQHWLGRRISAQIGGAYVHHPRLKSHLILINLPRIDLSKPKSLETVVAEETLHMRDWIDGDRRRHAKHGYDRIAFRVSEITGASIGEVRACLLPVERRPFKYEYGCPRCGVVIRRRVKGTWSCARCSPKFDRRCVFQLLREI